MDRLSHGIAHGMSQPCAAALTGDFTLRQLGAVLTCRSDQTFTLPLFQDEPGDHQGQAMTELLVDMQAAAGRLAGTRIEGASAWLASQAGRCDRLAARGNGRGPCQRTA